MLNESKKLLAKRIIYILIASKIIYLLADLFFAKQKMSLIIIIFLLFDIIVAFKITKQNIKWRIFLGILINSIFHSFLCYYFLLDLHFIPTFCILFIIPAIIFEGVPRLVLQVFTVLNITLILFLYKQSYQYWAFSEEEIFIIFLRVLYYVCILIISFFIADFYKNRSNDNIKISDHANLTNNFYIPTDSAYAVKDLQYIFESIERRDNSFMATFLNEYPEFVDKILSLNPKINEKEIEICAFIKLGLTTKEIAIATNSTYKSIEAKKYRIRKKINIDSSINLVLFFNSL